MRLGLSSFAFAWASGFAGPAPEPRLTPHQFLQAAADLGVRHVQLCDNLPLASLTAAELDSFEALSRNLGLQVQPGLRGLAAEDLRAHLDLARRFRSPFVRLVLDRPGDQPSPRQAVARLRPAVAAYRAAGVKIALENHDRFRAATLAQMVEGLGPETVGICLDTANSLAVPETLETVAAALKPFTLCVHVKDFAIRRADHGLGFIVEGRPAGRGQLNLPWLLATLRAAERDLDVLLESWPPPEPTLPETLAKERRWAAEGLAYLRTLIAPPPALTRGPGLGSNTAISACL